MGQNNIEKERLYLLKRHNFYGNLMYKVDLSWGDDIKTAAVWVKGKICMRISPKFWGGLTETQRIGVLMHEMDHLIMGHLQRGETDVSREQHSNNNVAMDLAINEYNSYLDGMSAMRVEEFNEKYKVNMERFREYEYYKKWIDEKIAPEHGEVGEPMDDHDKWSSGDDPGDEEIGREILRQALEESAKQSGDIPNHVEEALRKFGESKISWKSVLKKFIARAASSNNKATRSRRNRRFGLDQPGKREVPVLNIACAVDTSASVSMGDLAVFMTEMEKIAQNFKVTIIESDCEVHKVYTLRKGQQIENFTGRGGTSYAPAQKKVLELKSDVLLYFTDGDPAEVLDKFKVPMLWCLCGGVKKAPAPYGKVLNVS